LGGAGLFNVGGAGGTGEAVGAVGAVGAGGAGGGLGMSGVCSKDATHLPRIDKRLVELRLHFAEDLVERLASQMIFSKTRRLDNINAIEVTWLAPVDVERQIVRNAVKCPQKDELT
jgi:hypothetical protein